MCMLDEIRARCACRGAIRSPEVAKQRAATRSQEAARDEIYAIARRHKAEKLWVFGSCARKEERPDSDVDLLVKLKEDIGLLEYVRMERELSQLLGRQVEFTVNSVLLREPRFAARVCREAVVA